VNNDRSPDLGANCPWAHRTSAPTLRCSEGLEMTVKDRFVSSRTATWLIKHVASPRQRRLLTLTNGRVSLTGRAPVLLLTTTGRKSGTPRTVPLFYLVSGRRLIVCNVRPPSERPNPWPLNLRAEPRARARVGRDTFDVAGREATPSEVEMYWPDLVRLWPAYAAFFEKTGQRSVFVLEPVEASANNNARREK
jgi:F420H(2)-dependent quinone reductase